MSSYPIFKQQLPTCSNNIIIIIINHFIYCLAVMRYCDQGICQLGVKLFAEESFLLGIDWSLTRRCNASNGQFLFLFPCSALLFQGICLLGAKLFAEESFLSGTDWSLTSRCNTSNDQFLFFFLALWYCDQGICQLGAKLFAEESFLLGIDWSLTSRCNAANGQFLLFFFPCSVVLWPRYMPVGCEAFCWGILSVRHWLVIYQ